MYIWEYCRIKSIRNDSQHGHYPSWRYIITHLVHVPFFCKHSPLFLSPSVTISRNNLIKKVCKQVTHVSLFNTKYLFIYTFFIYFQWIHSIIYSLWNNFRLEKLHSKDYLLYVIFYVIARIFALKIELSL